MRTPARSALSARSTAVHFVTKDPWEAAVQVIRASPQPWKSAAFGRLYKLALTEGPRKLGRFRMLDEALRHDLASETVIDKRFEIVDAINPRAYFCTAVRNAARSWLRSPRSKLAEKSEPVEQLSGALDQEEARALDRLDALLALDSLDVRHRMVLVADAEGHSREDIARSLHTSRANVDQIISRARRSVARRDQAARCQSFSIAIVLEAA